MKKLFVILVLSAAGLLSFASAQTNSPASGVANAEFSSLLRTHPGGGDGLAKGVEELLTREPAVAGAIARQSKKVNCDQAAAVALGVSRAIVASKRTDRELVKKIYQPFEQACGNCRAQGEGQGQGGAGASADDGQRMCRVAEKPDPAHPTRIRSARGEDCFCALIAALAAQTYAQSEAGERMGFFADELSGNGGANGTGPWLGNNVSGN